MALSADTQAIIAELRNQGNYTRHKSTNYSIKALKVELGKFQDTFTAIKESMAGVQALTTQQSEFDKLRAKREEEITSLEEEDRDAYRKTMQDNLKREQSLKKEDLERREKENKAREKRDFKIFGKDGVLTKALTSSFNFAKGVLMIGALGAIGYEIIAGTLETLMPETFGPTGKFGEIPTFFELIGKAAAGIASIDWKRLGETIEYLTSPNFLLAAGAVATGPALAAGAGSIIQSYQLNKILAASGAGAAAGYAGKDLFSDIDKDGKSKKSISKLRLGVIGGLLLFAEAVIPAIQDFFRISGGKITADDVSTIPPDPTDIGTVTGNVASASLLALAAPGGPLVKAIVGFASFGILTAVDFFKKARDDDPFSNAFEELITESSEAVALSEERIKSLKYQKSLVKDNAEATADLERQIQAEEENLAQIKKDELDSALKNYKLLIDKKAQLEKVTFGPDLTDEEVGRRVRVDKMDEYKRMSPYQKRNMTEEEKAAFFIGDDPAQIALYRAFIADNRRRTTERHLASKKEEIDIIVQQMDNALRRYPALRALIDAEGFRTGTGGFHDFGNGSVAILHGHEAVIPRDSVEGQILQRLRSGFAETQSLKIEDVLAAGSMMGLGGTTIINSSPSAPTNVNISRGGDRVAHTRVNQGGGASFADMNPGGVLA